MKNLDGISIPFTVSFFDRSGRQYFYTGCTDYEIKDGVLMFVTEGERVPKLFVILI